MNWAVRQAPVQSQNESVRYNSSGLAQAGLIGAVEPILTKDGTLTFFPSEGSAQTGISFRRMAVKLRSYG